MIGVIGCGNMSSAIVKGIYNKNKDYKFNTYTPSFTRAKILASEVNGHPYKDLSDLVNDSKYIIIACKPQQFSDLTKDLQEFDIQSKVFISIMAAIPAEKICAKLGTENVIRVMPSMPSELGEGISLLYSQLEDGNSNLAFVDDFMSYCSKVYHCSSQEQFDQLTTISGSGPAYIYYIADILARKAQDWGMETKTSQELVIQLIKGSMMMMDHKKDQSFSELVDAVTSKKGVTIEAMDEFKRKGLSETLNSGLECAYGRSVEITREFDKK